MLLMPMFRDEFYDSFLDKLPAPCAQSRTDVMETADAFVIKVDLPGFDKDQFDIEVGPDHVVRLSGKQSEEKETEGAKYHMRERSQVEFSRSFRLPQNIKQQEVSAGYENGVLTVTVPKAEKAAEKLKVQVK
ncbi:Heat_shock protein [Hexamita inflata]|uniref:Heat shock protein n=2 Tax=Hexamita inflata TaxID=28002 RepID=A0AA86QI01_9EUKA|nr:Heat shock protein [Hexamita inflata]CAI9954993.1 Heat shock protein [Hexamita inflata]CAI9954995.1 Heat shock protein [Hexamita inflata]CAI9965225.1 Heat shock protein [Hexamita inflata]CAI9965230.1 Heat shock protein [Hexamita inflata]